MYRRHLVLSLMACFWTWPAFADPMVRVPDARRVGSGRMTYLTLPVFDATLYAPGGVYSPTGPFALSLSYLMKLKGRDIARSSIEQMRHQGGHSNARLKAWGETMAGIFPDVAKGAILTGVRDADGATSFYQHGKVIGRIEDPDFSRAFFDIWLGEKTSQPALRKKLLGMDA